MTPKQLLRALALAAAAMLNLACGLALAAAGQLLPGIGLGLLALALSGLAGRISAR